MRALIVDDEPVARQVLRELLEECDGVEVAGEAASGVEAIQQMLALKPEVVFMDYEMPGLDGLNAVRALRGTGPDVIFVTAYQEHALAAFDVGAVDYLLKPVRLERLAAALEKVRRQPARTAEAGGLRKIMAQAGGGLLVLNPDQVIAFQAEAESVYIITGKNRHSSTYRLKELQQQLPSPPFRRIHRQAIINTDHIRRIAPLSSRRWMLTMSNGMEVVVSKRSAGELRDGLKW
ncbi:MAG: response regulator transcription factor [Acidimicrobiia bacterium]|nr:response regulator transcription factor [Acidimicrobiia bacterium]